MGTQMTKERMEAYTQIIEILKHMDKQYVEKVPLKLRNFFEANCSKEYDFNINLNISLKEQNLKAKTLNILAMLNINFWCETKEHRQELNSLYSENERKYQEELREKYNPDNIFRNKNILEESVQREELALVDVSSIPLHKKIFNKIKMFLKIFVR